MRVTDKFVFFCKGILGNWAKTPMEYDGYKFFSSEQLFMYLKAKYFGDDEIKQKIIHCKTSAESKDLGRQVKNFNQKEWDAIKSIIMREALIIKGNYSEEFRLTLQQYAGKTFVECNPEDHIWAIGKAEDDLSINDPNNWDGQNILGYILTELSKHF